VQPGWSDACVHVCTAAVHALHYQCIICLQVSFQPSPPGHRCREAADQEQLAASISAATRTALQAGTVQQQQQEVLQPDPGDCLLTAQGAKATMRLAQALLAGYCAKLPGCDR
jgi:hypothetical protein